MRLLFTIPHYCNPAIDRVSDGKAHGSVGKDPSRRVQALTSCIRAVHRLFSRDQCVIKHAQAERGAWPIEQITSGRIDVVVCTTQHWHLLDRLPLPASLYTHEATSVEPALLGFECHRVLGDRIGAYDYYCYLEDDLVLHDPWFFLKLAWFTSLAGAESVLQPKRYEIGEHDLVQKVYVDGDLREQVTAAFQQPKDTPQIVARVFGIDVTFERPLNPHSGCFFLSAAQMASWARQPFFLSRETNFIGPLESAATLGLLRAFKIYKPAVKNADFLEVQHFGDDYLSMITRPDRTS